MVVSVICDGTQIEKVKKYFFDKNKKCDIVPVPFFNECYVFWFDQTDSDQQLFAISININNLKFIDEPSEEVQYLVISQYPEFIYALKKINDNIKMILKMES